MILIDQWPEEVVAAHQAHKSAAETAAQRRDFETAAAEFQAAVDDLREAQPERHRYHKGESLHNLGFVLLFAGNERRAIEVTVLAFIEDCLSRAEESPRTRDELDRPAAHNLVYVFGVPGRKVADLSSWIRLIAISGQIVADPATLLAEERVKDVIATASEPTGKRIPGIFNSPPHKRVFVGGYYGQGLLETVLRPIRDQVKHLTYDGVLADDFAIPAGQDTDEHAISLLLSCHYAVFDFTERGGQEEEFARLPDTMKDRTLVIYDSRVPGAPKVSGGMTMPKMGRWGITPVPFEDGNQLSQIVRDFLP
jgi:hypothetical protein